MIAQRLNSLAGALEEGYARDEITPHIMDLAVFLLRQYAGDVERMERTSAPVSPSSGGLDIHDIENVVRLDDVRRFTAELAGGRSGKGPAA